MFCPKCGTKNPDDGKFCRKCGTDISSVSEALSGKLKFSESHSLKKYKKKETSWEGAISTLFTGIAFLIVAIVLSFQPFGQAWWFWMLIPAFGSIGTGIAKIIQLRQSTSENTSINLSDDTNQISSKNEQNYLPPKQTSFVSNMPDAKYNTGELVPPSVVEDTTRHLEMDSEGETMTLPKNKTTIN